MLNSLFTRKVPTQVKWMFVLVILPLYFYCSSIIGSALIKFLMITFSWSFSYNDVNCYLNLIVDFGMMMVVGFIMKKMIIAQWQDLKQDLKGHFLYGLVIGPALIYGLGLIGGILTLMLGGQSTSENQQLIEAIAIAHPVLMILTSVGLAPLLEEWIFRGIVFGWVYELSPRLAHFVSAFIFGFIHIMMSILAGNIAEWVQIFSYFFMGLALSYLYEKKNNIFVPVMAHAMNNLISMLMILL